jgi:hypothetical protein
MLFIGCFVESKILDFEVAQLKDLYKEYPLQWRRPMFKKIIKRLLVKWELVYSTQDVAEYSSIKGKLENSDITYKTKSISSGGGEGGGYGFSTIYQILVPKEEAYRANEAIHHSKP